MPGAMSCCPEGWTYDSDPAVENCAPPADTDTGDADTASDSSTDAAPSGLGATCEGDADCAGYDADYCAIAPGESEGYCTEADCDPGGCASGYQCCDCTASSLVDGVACLTDDDAELAGAAGCTCE